MKIFITGAAGFIGSNLSDALLARGDAVCGFDNFDDFYPRAVKERNLEQARRSASFKLVEGDIRDSAALSAAIKDFSPDVVVHLAARAGVRPSIEQPELYAAVNLTGTVNVLEAMRANGVKKLVFASSSSVYGNAPHTPFSETDPVDNPISPYAATKKAGELLCYTYHHLFQMDIFCLRFFTVYGRRQRPDLAIHKFTRMLAAGKAIPFFGDGKTRRDYTYIDDILQGVIASIDRCKGYNVFNLGESSPVELDRLVSLIAKELGAELKLDRQPMQPGDVMVTYADVSRAREALGYAPHTAIDDGIREFVKWFKSVK